MTLAETFRGILGSVIPQKFFTSALRKPAGSPRTLGVLGSLGELDIDLTEPEE